MVSLVNDFHSQNVRIICQFLKKLQTVATIDPCAVEPKGGTARHRLHQVASAVINSSDASLMQTLMNAKRVVVVYKDKVIKFFY